MAAHILGLHHVTATVAQAQPDLDFYTGLLGMRLVKRTVNFDNPYVYHFYYGNERGDPGTIMTTFPYAGTGVAVGRHGAGQITVTSFTVPADSLEFWHARLVNAEVAVSSARDAFGADVLQFPDPSGLAIRMVAAADERSPWTGGEVDARHAVRGVHGVTLSVLEPARTAALLTGLLGYEVVDETGETTRLAPTHGAAPGRLVELQHAPEQTPAGVNGLGTVHHVAFAIGTPEEQLALRGELVGQGFSVTEVRDRQYFRSIYFREPNGVLFEVATVPPGFTVDEDLASLGRALKLPPWEEQRRTEIEGRLAVVHP